MTTLLLPATVSRNVRALRSLAVACERLRGRLPAPQNFDSGLDYCYPQPFKPLIIALPADMIGQTPIPRGKNKRPTIPGVILSDCAHVRVIEPVTLWHAGMRAA